jgi:ribose transport system ATP-binding protein
VKGLTALGVTNATLDVRPGEIVGIGGLVGSGRTELLMAIMGDNDVVAGDMWVGGEQFAPKSPHGAMKRGVSLVPESRKEQGLLLKQSVQHNLSLAQIDSVTTPGGMIRGGYETERATDMIVKLNVQPPTTRNRVNSLSGGNQQKVLFGKWLFKEPRLFIIDEPTRGIDVGAKQEIYSEINKLAKEGLAIVMVSSELPEVLGLSDRVMVLHEGKLTGEFRKADATPEKVMAAATGNN